MSHEADAWSRDATLQSPAANCMTCHTGSLENASFCCACCVLSSYLQCRNELHCRYACDFLMQILQGMPIVKPEPKAPEIAPALLAPAEKQAVLIVPAVTELLPLQPAKLAVYKLFTEQVSKSPRASASRQASSCTLGRFRVAVAHLADPSAAARQTWHWCSRQLRHATQQLHGNQSHFVSGYHEYGTCGSCI